MRDLRLTTAGQDNKLTEGQAQEIFFNAFRGRTFPDRPSYQFAKGFCFTAAPCGRGEFGAEFICTLYAFGCVHAICVMDDSDR